MPLRRGRGTKDVSGLPAAAPLQGPFLTLLHRHCRTNYSSPLPLPLLAPDDPSIALLQPGQVGALDANPWHVVSSEEGSVNVNAQGSGRERERNNCPIVAWFALMRVCVEVGGVRLLAHLQEGRSKVWSGCLLDALNHEIWRNSSSSAIQSQSLTLLRLSHPSITLP